MIGIIGILSASNNVAPPSTNSRSSRDVDDGIILMANVLVASEFTVVHILNRVVTVRSSDALELTLIHTVDADLLEDRMANTDASEAENSSKVGDLHDGGREREETLNMSCR